MSDKSVEFLLSLGINHKERVDYKDYSFWELFNLLDHYEIYLNKLKSEKTETKINSTE